MAYRFSQGRRGHLYRTGFKRDGQGGGAFQAAAASATSWSGSAAVEDQSDPAKPPAAHVARDGSTLESREDTETGASL